MINCDKTKHMCTDKNYATCVYYEKNVPDFSSLSDQDCTTIEETTEDIYNILSEIKNGNSLSALGESCIQYVGQNLTVKDILLRYEEEICNLKEQIEELSTTKICNSDITNCGLPLSELTDPCGDQITNLKQLLAYLIDKVETP